MAHVVVKRRRMTLLVRTKPSNRFAQGSMDETPRRFYHANFQRYLLAGLLTITPLIAVWLVFNFFLNVLSAFGQPIAAKLTEFVDRNAPAATPWLADPGVRWIIAVIVALLALYT